MLDRQLQRTRSIIPIDPTAGSHKSMNGTLYRTQIQLLNHHQVSYIVAQLCGDCNCVQGTHSLSLVIKWFQGGVARRIFGNETHQIIVCHCALLIGRPYCHKTFK